ncbi:carbohydrate ABC transporter substrate-binding protein (CUT1 family) [Labedella gwakjiensis]|uniref:Carbohydrate ABC transporter substrate-binding protein (CUT1 family) n=1 Tax=Labedella gwakjiensis TaxID=390269 RepID=A0A2P8GZB7_9MICO|nr:extracellular solute-binding protein [Labedella gwakjiensis]PSL39319.1 carbohydrate ABC transporter substrate-binding protein (CUT1 family) [Labedella gwakjiensis]RUQ86262.1 extracellular solute-binding protein [Labedella gwakjiensis]
MHSIRRGIAATVAVAALALTGCSATGGGDDGPVALDYWAWAPNIDKVVDIWNEQNPDIQVTVQKQDGGDPVITKLLTALKAGSGAPDLIQAEYQKIPTLVSSDALADISGDLDDSVEGTFAEGLWSSVTLGGDAVYAIPQDSGPMMFYYREDIFAELGLEVPTTWDEYAEVAAAVHDSDPSRYLGTFSANDAGWFTGLAQQAGASWWSIDGDAWGVDIDESPTQKVAEYWGGLVEEGVIDNKPMYTPEWNAGLNDGSQVGWLSAVWAPGVLSGNAADTAGLWRAAPMPQWDADAPATGAWGGSTTAVTTQTDQQAAAVEFATWLNTDPEAVAAMADTMGIYPAATEVASDALSTSPDFFSNQDDFYDVAAEAAASIAPFTYGPNVNVTFSAYNDEFAKAAEAKTTSAFLDALAAMQTITVDDLEKTGFTVE